MIFSLIKSICFIVNLFSYVFIGCILALVVPFFILRMFYICFEAIKLAYKKTMDLLYEDRNF